MYAAGTSTYRSSGAETTCANAIAGCVIRYPSTSAAETFSPPTFNMSFSRETNVTRPSISISQISPVLKKPLLSKTSPVNSGSRKYPSNIFGPRYQSSPTLPFGRTSPVSGSWTSASIPGIGNPPLVNRSSGSSSSSDNERKAQTSVCPKQFRIGAWGVCSWNCRRRSGTPTTITTRTESKSSSSLSG